MNLEYALLAIPHLLLAFTCHEFAHAWTALRQGDDTAYMLGRVTLNPVAHLDPVGSVLLPALGLIGGGMLFGWAKPVPVNTRKFRNYKRGDLIVSLAGVTANALLALVFTAALAGVGLAIPALGSMAETLIAFCVVGIELNVLLLFFNLLPIPPLDGSRVLYHFLSPAAGARLRALEPYGWMILLAVVFFGGFAFLRPLIDAVVGALARLAGFG